MIPKSRLLLFTGSNYGVIPASPENEPRVITCPCCGEDTYEGETCLECANGERQVAA